jgi:DNA-binding transcriptional LysR family regulator
VLELEGVLGTPMFDRSLRSARLTEKGEQMFAIARDLLGRRDAAIERFAQAEPPEQSLRIGVTEMVAMTWLPRLVAAVHSRFPRASFEPDVDVSSSLRDKLLKGDLDMVILPDLFEDNRIAKAALGKVRNAWMAQPGLLPPGRHRVHDIAAQRVLTQGARSATGQLYDEWFRAAGITAANRIVSNSLLAIIGMTVSGLGVAHLPQACLRPMVDLGLLEVLRVSPAVPDVPFVAAHRADRHSTVVDTLVDTARACCDFRQAFQARAGQSAFIPAALTKGP